MSLCCEFGGILWNQPLKITKWGHFKDSKWSRHKMETFRKVQFCVSKVQFCGSKVLFGCLKFQTSLQISNITSGEEIVKSTMFSKVCYVLYSGIKNYSDLWWGRGCPLEWASWTGGSAGGWGSLCRHSLCFFFRPLEPRPACVHSNLYVWFPHKSIFKISFWIWIKKK